MKTVPMFMRGAFRAALKVGLEDEWVVARQKDLMNAWSSDQVDTVVELTKLVHDGATQMKELMTPVPPSVVANMVP